ncbi:hypothetical protein BOX30_11130 [Leptospirillum ferriphilum]|uniref:Uncharacterized protein n=2 Tax=Leptospirillum ferriphilum TaxID=178606 RepID=A0A059XWW5_9BACT|nr:hypothetical protein Y981_00845 [Leptospirillum ferriphilum YSK]AKS22592.1 hypothetical protein ABH19_00725 [Leptospirillum sp. Group II 'CF-1']OOH71962.1 hypothetical protein BOX24_07795 [Leptospirillum ferriphilum]OOH76213.1 hypothetical protein BOX30_11130 [Leptospirillum ferriphilum]
MTWLPGKTLATENMSGKDRIVVRLDCLSQAHRMEFAFVGTHPLAGESRHLSSAVSSRLRERETGRSLSFSFIFGGMT